MAYRIHLENFEGPLDLLLYFIQRDRIDIYDIPIAHITAEYLSYLELMEALNITVAGEFIVLAATLMHIKARMLLPRPEPIEDELLEDPRRELVQQLLEYQRFKLACQDLGRMREQRQVHFPVGGSLETDGDGAGLGEYLRDVSLFQMMSVFKEVMNRMTAMEPLRIRPEPLRLDDRIRVIRQAFAATTRLTFRRILEAARSLQEVIVTFLAVLEMIRQGMIKAEQESPFAELYLLKTHWV